jgi:hypothetical protein
MQRENTRVTPSFRSTLVSFERLPATPANCCAHRARRLVWKRKKNEWTTQGFLRTPWTGGRGRTQKEKKQLTIFCNRGVHWPKYRGVRGKKSLRGIQKICHCSRDTVKGNSLGNKKGSRNSSFSLVGKGRRKNLSYYVMHKTIYYTTMIQYVPNTFLIYH